MSENAAMSRRVFLHVGSPKTGTTFLQAVLWKNRALAREQGLLLPLEGGHAHYKAALDLLGTPEFTADPASVPGTWQRLVDEVAAWDGDALITHEKLAQASADEAARAVGSLRALGREVHIVLTARDLARQLPAEWQERVKHHARGGFDDFMDWAADPTSTMYPTLWAVQDYADIVHRWGDDLPPAQVHVVTVPRPGAPKGLLWERFAGLLGLDAGAFDLDVARDNTSLGVEQAELLRRVNINLGDRLPRPGPYAPIVKGILAHDVLASRPGTRLVLGGADLAFARDRSAAIVTELERIGVDVVGDLAELLVDDTDAPEQSTGRAEIATETLLQEALEASIGLLERLHERQQRHAAEIRSLRARLAEAEAAATRRPGGLLRRLGRRRSG